MLCTSTYPLFHKLRFSMKHILVVAVVWFVAIDVTQQYCSQFGRQHLQHQCVLTPESVEGPFYLDDQLIRRDIREDRQGLPLKLRLTLTDVNTCEPLSNVSIDVWQCDAIGDYSGYIHANITRWGHAKTIDNTRWLRGIQMTDKNGVAEFMTVFPGWYSGRATHIHILSHTGNRTIHTGQLYFPEEMLKRIDRLYPYNTTKSRRQTNEKDRLYRKFKGANSMLAK
ncbi:unnamed protein product [Medioppia subpectinata]|uniref:Intradiol dioxygenase n=1 Tax=Medioppia subpectinata TaxID=1979941 RepID=A0A7R9LB18_9ACAR|nr:unnamed protein product [Medioppia subpectinata]CAG2117397.1 unnamed protein product [Medioppia subpectinata]